ncbi:hypothetical protein PQJ75_18915 [Rhodoplanes sp. TEM]|uniref:SPOR domain-containing protein n=1 Tax=Rhodoplanes tepidamans TaxID=200616 RepID=A0ABT5JI46_RHOTP|nr:MULTISPECIES: hypothetical protein [Rhodoplanes]MDC7789254.1 hypothetical protein [Rhodoplanes tepidamans]MDC7985808.1 hypothetical protein [Rhodoplanes sp. TEM]MDQ0358866.1 hypothetical protein [Rhodoplanes tepidamans]
MTDVARQHLIDDEERPGLGPLLRLVAWGLAASGALAVAVLAAQSQSDLGERRVAAVTAPLAAQTEATREATAQTFVRVLEAEREAKRLGETVKALTADRDRLAERVTKLEGHIEDLTGSIALIQPARRGPAGSDFGDLMLLPPVLTPGTFRPPETGPAARPLAAGSHAVDPRTVPPIDTAGPLAGEPLAGGAMPPVMASASVAVPHPEEPPAAAVAGTSVAGTVAGLPPSEIPLPRPNPNAQSLGAQAAALRADAPAAAAPAGARFAIEIGGPNSIDNLRALWAKVRDSQAGDLLAEVKPAIALRDGGKPGIVEMRLVAGPVANSLAASRLCASVAIAGVACRATSYDGQMLNLP